MKKILILFLSSILINTTYSQCYQPEWVMPKFEGNNYNDVIVVNDSLAIIVGDYGTIIRTTDQGATWSHIETNTNLSLTVIDFNNSGVGIIGGENGIVLKSYNYGKNWIEIDMYHLGTIESVNFLDANTVLLKILLPTSPARYYISYDLGDNWTLSDNFAPSPFDTPYKIQVHNGVIYADISSGINYSTDFGETWNYITNDYSLSDETYIMNEDLAFTIQGIYLKKWESGILTNIRTLSGSSEFTNLFALNEDSIFYNENPPSIYKKLHRTTNGGVSWESTNLIHLTDKYINDFSNLNFFITALSNDIGTILKSLNLGKSFQSYEFRHLHYSYITENNGIDFINDEIGYISVDNYKILKTDNYGNHWKEIKTPTTNIKIKDLKFINENIGFYVGEPIDGTIDNFFKTTNGGNTWQNQSLNSGSILSTIYFLNDTIGYIGAGGNKVYKTTDQGNTWSSLSTLTTTSVVDFVFFVDENNGFAERNKTTNGGITWTTFSPTIGNINDGHFFNPLSGIICTNSYAFRTTNGGSTWLPVTGSGAKNFVDFNDNFGVIDGDYYSTDYGANWTWHHTGNLKRGVVTNTNKVRAIRDKYFYVSDNGIDYNIPQNSFKVVDFQKLNDSVQFVLDGYNVMYTSNRGMNWYTNIPSSGSFYNPEKIHFINNDTAFFNNIYGDFKKSTVKSLSPAINLLSSGLDADNIIKNAFFESGIYYNECRGSFENFGYKSTDYGITWSLFNFPLASLTTQLTVVTDSILLVNENTSLWASYDGGQNWITKPNVPSANIYSFSKDSIFCFKVVGNNMKIYLSTNYGDNWDSSTVITDNEYTYSYITGIQKISNSDVIISLTSNKHNVSLPIDLYYGIDTYYERFLVNLSTNNVYKLKTLTKNFDSDSKFDKEAYYFRDNSSSAIYSNANLFRYSFTDSLITPTANLIIPTEPCNNSLDFAYVNTDFQNLNPTYIWIVNSDTFPESIYGEINLDTITTVSTISCIVKFNSPCSALEELILPSVTISPILNPNIYAAGTNLFSSITGDNYYWLENGVLLPFNSISIPFNYDSLYQLVVENGSCLSDTVSYTPYISLDENKKLEVIIFPNPTKSCLQINFSDFVNTNISIEIVNVSGNIIKKISTYLNNNYIVIPIDELLDGYYVLSIHINDNLYCKSFVKN